MMRALAPLLAGLAIASLGCDSPSGGSGQIGGNHDSGSNNPVYTPPAGSTVENAASHRTSYSCGSSSDCQYWFCNCADGSVVNSSHCDNGACLDASASCTSACTAFGTSWTGSAGGGPGSTPPADNLPASNTSACGGFGSSNASCDACTKSECCNQGARCGGNVECLLLWDCIVPCNGDQQCLSYCYDDYPGGASDFGSLLDCSVYACADECAW